MATRSFILYPHKNFFLSNKNCDKENYYNCIAIVKDIIGVSSNNYKFVVSSLYYQTIAASPCLKLLKYKRYS
jgi:hypothetical protein